LSLGHDIKVISFSRQYPTFLYPGSKQKEYSSFFPLFDRVFYLIDTINPLTWIFTLKYILKEKPDVCIFKYWHFYFVPTYIFLLFFLRKKIKLVALVDNLYSHEKNIFHTFLSVIGARLFFYFIDYSITQSLYVSRQFKDIFPNKKEIMLPHPVYNNFGIKVNKDIARSDLKLKKNSKLLLFF
jgi:hypothetical protein